MVVLHILLRDFFIFFFFPSAFIDDFSISKTTSSFASETLKIESSSGFFLRHLPKAKSHPKNARMIPAGPSTTINIDPTKSL
jgi:hypothetical protein